MKKEALLLPRKCVLQLKSGQKKNTGLDDGIWMVIFLKLLKALYIKETLIYSYSTAHSGFKLRICSVVVHNDVIHIHTLALKQIMLHEHTLHVYPFIQIFNPY